MRLHGTLTVVSNPFYRGEFGVVRVIGASRDKFTLRSIHGYIRKKSDTAHDI